MACNVFLLTAAILFRICSSSGTEYKLMDNLQKLENAFQNYEKQVHENGMKLLYLLKNVSHWKANFQTRLETKEDKRLIVVGNVTRSTVAQTTTHITPTVPQELCEDKVNNCREYDHDKICPLDQPYRPWAEVRCRKFCGICVPAFTVTLPCKDTLANCHEYNDDLCTNPLYNIFKEDNCRAYCKLCNATSTSTGGDLYNTTISASNSSAATLEPLLTTEKTPMSNEIVSTTTQATTLSTTTERMILPIVFHAKLSTFYPIMSPRQVIAFDKIITNVGNSYDAVFGVFKVPYSGFYEFIVTVSAARNYSVDVSLVNNNMMLCKAHASSPDQGIGVCVAMVHANKDDDIFVRHDNGIGTHLSGTEGYSSFSGQLIFAD